MPELPEVEIMTRNLARWTVGRRLQQLELRDASLDSGGVAEWASQAVGATVRRVWRRGKYTVLELDRALPALVLHFRMTGKVVAAEPAVRRSVRLVLRLEPAVDRPACVVFDDARRLGNAWARSPDGLAEWFQNARKLGPEPWPGVQSAAFWAEQLGTIRSPIKVALMRQDRVAGLGNIAASEILWRAGIAPTLEARALSARQWAAVAHAVPQFIEDTIDRESGDEIAYVNSGGGSTRGVSSPFTVYRCAGRPCPSCGDTIARFKQAGRSTFWCPSCQAQ